MSFFSLQKISLSGATGLVLFVFLLGGQPVFAQNNYAAEPGKGLALPYQSVFGSYQSYQEQPVSSWRAINDEVEKIGGWRAYAREASKSDADQVEVEGKADALPSNKAHRHQGGSHE